MRAIFLSDAHIRDHADPNMPPLVAFLRHLAGRVDRLVLVGDLFHTWFGFPRAVFAGYVPVLNALMEVREAGTEIVYITGNHDFEMGSFFTDILEAEIHDTSCEMKVDGRKLFVAHGDLAGKGDWGYRVLRFVLRAWPTRFLGRHLPPSWIWRIGQMLHHSCSGDGGDRTGYMPMFEEYAAKQFDKGFDTVILAHSHCPVFQEDGETLRAYVNLGDWIDKRTYLLWDEGRLTLKQWLWPEGVEEDYGEAS
jgi:UDP-2,3-diacylglucosamine hydrolase